MAWGLRALVAVGVLASPALSLTCPKLCSGHGRCDTGSRQCLCFNGWFGADCSMVHCPFAPAWADIAIAKDHGHNLAECSNKGLCDYETGKCKCYKGFEGQACERKTCPNKCNHHGRCQSMSYFASLADVGEGTVYEYTDPWDAEMMYGCNCDAGYFGPDCSLKECPRGDDPFTGTSIVPATQQYNEKQEVVCKASGGTFTLTFRGETTARIPWDASAAELQSYLNDLSTISSKFTSGVEVIYVGTVVKACSTGGTRIQIEFLQDFGDLPLMTSDALKLTNFAGTASITVTTVVEGTKENEWCSNRGLCDVTTGVCSCSENYETSDGYGNEGQRGDCGYATVSITNCPGEIACSGHGVCKGYPTYRCQCSNGWTGADCSEMTCPYGRSWFELPQESQTAHLTKTECSDMGICDRQYGVCNCMEGFEGAACERMKCPGSTPCSGHGECMTMALLAGEASINGVATPYTYGSIPNDPLRWDYDKMQGCRCDDGYWGPDCSRRVCPIGDDPETINQVDAIQELSCRDTAGDAQFTLTFRGETTSVLSGQATMAQLKAALEALSTVKKVSILNGDTNDKVCDVATKQVYITFLVAHGDLPLLTVTQSSADFMEVKAFYTGTKEMLECSGRGLCDYDTGTCQCFTGFTSSDGMGGPGTFGDCGYQDPIIAPFYVGEVE